MQSDKQKIECSVNGLLRGKGLLRDKAMCPHILVGAKLCGLENIKCDLQVIQPISSKQPAPERESKLVRAEELDAIAALIIDDAAAISYQSLAQYRSALLQAIRARKDK